MAPDSLLPRPGKASKPCFWGPGGLPKLVFGAREGSHNLFLGLPHPRASWASWASFGWCPPIHGVAARQISGWSPTSSWDGRPPSLGAAAGQIWGGHPKPAQTFVCVDGLPRPSALALGRSALMRQFKGFVGSPARPPPKTESGASPNPHAEVGGR